MSREITYREKKMRKLMDESLGEFMEHSSIPYWRFEYIYKLAEINIEPMISEATEDELFIWDKFRELLDEIDDLKTSLSIVCDKCSYYEHKANLLSYNT